jgi:hypothetical protein
MRPRAAIHDDFVARFHFGEGKRTASDLKLDEMETALGTRLPAAYRTFMKRHGVVYTPDILKEIVEKNLDHPDVQDILEPREAIVNTRAYWSGGMPDNVIGIASDCMGNMIGFHRQAVSSDDAPVVFFDHDFVEVYEVAPSFDEFLVWYLDHLRGRVGGRG